MKPGKSEICYVSFKGFDNIPTISNKVEVIVTRNEFGSLNINIAWEDEPFKLKNYRDFGLFGYYSTDFGNIEYRDDDNSLTIEDSNRCKIILYY